MAGLQGDFVSSFKQSIHYSLVLFDYGAYLKTGEQFYDEFKSANYPAWPDLAVQEQEAWARMAYDRLRVWDD